MASKNHPDIHEAMEHTLALPSLGDALTDAADHALKWQLDNPVVQQIPVLKSVFDIAKVGMDIQQLLFSKRVVAFLGELKDTSTTQRQAFIAKHANDKGHRKLGETIISLLARAENAEKARLMGLITAAAIQGSVALDKAMRLCAMVDRAYLEDLSMVRTFIRPRPSTSTEAESLKSVGFLKQRGYNTQGTKDLKPSSQPIYELSEFGRLFLEITREGTE